MSVQITWTTGKGLEVLLPVNERKVFSETWTTGRFERCTVKVS